MPTPEKIDLDVMLAKRYESERHDWTNSAWFWSEKLDGVRAIYKKGSGLRTRGGHKIRIPREWRLQLRAMSSRVGGMLDGELWIGRGNANFNKVSGIARQHRATAEDWLEVKYLIFDAPLQGGTFEARLDSLHEAKQFAMENMHSIDMVRDSLGWLSRTKIVEHLPVRGDDEVQALLQSVEAQGGEGIMLREAASLWTGSRSSSLLKVKSFKDADAFVIGHQPGRGRHAGRMGALFCCKRGPDGQYDPNGPTFKVGTGFSDADRENPPPVGSVISYKYFEESSSGKPRFPAFDRWRPDLPCWNMRDTLLRVSDIS